jgi:3-deoxy-7-phosphoheptulonate synthase
VDIGGVKVGGREFTLMAGPCSVESEEQCTRIAEAVAESGVRIFRGGAYKPRSSPYTFQGLGEQGLEILAKVRERFGLKIVTEAVDTETLGLVAQYTDIIQIGARNMQNYSLLKKAGQTGKPILLKRGQAATLDELLLSAEYILAENNPNVILCERGVRTLANHSRNTLDLSAIPFIKSSSHLPIIADPSHGTGRREKVLPLSRASMAVGADGIMVEVHNQPELALSDGAQSITLDMFRTLVKQLRRLAPTVDKVYP